MRPKTCSFSPPGFSISVIERANRKQTAENCKIGRVVLSTPMPFDEMFEVPCQVQSSRVRGGVPARPGPALQIVERVGGGLLEDLEHLDVGVVAGGGDLLGGVHDVVHRDHHVGLAKSQADLIGLKFDTP